MVDLKQWRNSQGQGGRGTECPPPRHLWPGTLVIGKFLLTYRETWKREVTKREGGKLEMERGKVENEERTFLFYFILFFFLLLFIYLFIYLFFLFFPFFLLFIPQNHWNLIWVDQNGSFLPGKVFHAGKKTGNINLPPPKNIHVTPLI